MSNIAEYDDDTGPDPAYSAWLDTLNEDVIQDEFGYEPGEFTVFPSEWHALYAEGLTPSQAWQRALDAFSAQRAKDDRAQAENWERIKAADAKYTHGHAPATRAGEG